MDYKYIPIMQLLVFTVKILEFDVVLLRASDCNVSIL